MTRKTIHNLLVFGIAGMFVAGFSGTAVGQVAETTTRGNQEVKSEVQSVDLRLQLQVYPNPVHENEVTTATVQVSAPDQLKLVMMDASGKVVIELPDIAVNKGEYTFDFNTAGLPKGVYFMSLTGQSTRMVQKLQVE